MKEFAEQGGCQAVMIFPGELHVALQPTIISTILGSCVAVCLHCPVTLTGAMCHGVMPTSPQPHGKDIFRFVDMAVAAMVDELTCGRQVCRPGQLVAKIFGGARLLSQRSPENNYRVSIGEQNIQAARQALAKSQIPLTVEKVGGLAGCKIFFYSHTGDVFYKRIDRA